MLTLRGGIFFLFSFFFSCSVPCQPVGGIFEAQQGAKCVELDVIQDITSHYVRAGMIKQQPW